MKAFLKYLWANSSKFIVFVLATVVLAFIFTDLKSATIWLCMMSAISIVVLFGDYSNFKQLNK